MRDLQTTISNEAPPRGAIGAMAVWLDAHKDAMASIQTTPSCIRLCDITGDGDPKLLVARLKAEVRELKEETGYTANASALAFARTSPIVPCDPGLSGSNMQAICMKVDVEADGNADPQDAQEDAECIEKHVVPSGGGCVRAMRAGAGSEAGRGTRVSACVRARVHARDG